ncbi:hypothetical protein PR048_002166 [Dryococelus australis]|uniref:Uncharacterized protein n=1 Tax=Dryococelus australis TaxID=614101 RepID=A0ABQ9IJF7_9NEOP|nr:hypothetical protein PR048_002166 [Dryococelus australis]
MRVKRGEFGVAPDRGNPPTSSIRCRERKINIKASERVNVDVFTPNKRPCRQHMQTQFAEESLHEERLYEQNYILWNPQHGIDINKETKYHCWTNITKHLGHFAPEAKKKKIVTLEPNNFILVLVRGTLNPPSQCYGRQDRAYLWKEEALGYAEVSQCPAPSEREYHTVDAACSENDGASTSTTALPDPTYITSEEHIHTSVEDVSSVQSMQCKTIGVQQMTSYILGHILDQDEPNDTAFVEIGSVVYAVRTVQKASGESGDTIAAARIDGVVQFCSDSGRERLRESCSQVHTTCRENSCLPATLLDTVSLLRSDLSMAAQLFQWDLARRKHHSCDQDEWQQSLPFIALLIVCATTQRKQPIASKLNCFCNRCYSIKLI